MGPRSLLGGMILILYQLFVILFFVPLLFFVGVWSGIAGLWDTTGDRAHRTLVLWARTSLALAGIRVDVYGLERLDPRHTYVFMLNHASFLDILLAFAHIPYNLRIITKEEIFQIPFLGWALRKSGQIPMDRTNPRRGLSSLQQASILLKQGISIVVFPEGTRTPNGEIRDFKATLFVLPIRTQVPVVPVLIEGTYQALKRGSMLLNPVPLKMTFHDPVAAGPFTDQDRALYAKRVHDVLAASPAPR